MYVPWERTRREALLSREIQKNVSKGGKRGVLSKISRKRRTLMDQLNLQFLMHPFFNVVRNTQVRFRITPVFRRFNFLSRLIVCTNTKLYNRAKKKEDVGMWIIFR